MHLSIIYNCNYVRLLLNVKQKEGTAPTVESLGGKWALSPTYGSEVNQLYQELITYSGAGSESNSENNSKKNITSTIGWKNENGNWYYYKSNNVKATGWISPDSNWFYLKDDGQMATGWINISGTRYYLNPISDGTRGEMKTGWTKIDGGWYYFNPISDGTKGAMKAGWVITDENSYYLDSTGKMVKNITINGFEIGADGKRQSGNNKIIAIDAAMITVVMGVQYIL